MYMKKNSPLTPFIWQEIRKMEETGITKILYERHRISEPNCKPIHTKGGILGIEKLASLFMILIFGIILSTIIFIFENVIQNWKSLPFGNFDTSLHMDMPDSFWAQSPDQATRKKKLLIKKIDSLINDLLDSQNSKSSILRNQLLQLLQECHSHLHNTSTKDTK